MLLKRLVFGCLMVLLCLPALQAKFKLFPVGPLDGWHAVAPHPELSYAEVSSNEYQPKLEAYLQDRLGFRPWLVRLNYQLAYSLFDVIKAKDLVRGKNDVLFQDWPIDSYYGRDYLGDVLVRRWAHKMKVIQDSLAERGVLFVFAITPNKVAYYPEYIPDNLVSSKKTSNYSAAIRELQAAGINLIDFTALFLRMKDTASYPLFPRGGTHWSGYGATLAADTLLRYIEKRGHLDLPDYRVVGREVVDSTRGTDADIATALNLMFEPKIFRMAYPRIQYEAPKPNQKKPNVLIVGDSFMWSFIDFYDYFPRLFDPISVFWYYNRRVGWPGTAPLLQNVESAPDVALLDRKAEIEKRDVVLVSFSDYNLKQLDFGFTEYTYPLYEHWSDAEAAQIAAITADLTRNWDTMNRMRQEAAMYRQDLNNYIREVAIDRFEADIAHDEAARPHERMRP